MSSTPSSLQNVTVLGSGVLGSQIIMQAAYAGKNVSVYDISQEFLDKLPERYEWMRAQYRDDLDDYSDQKFDAAIERITTSTDLDEAVTDADIVIESVTERLDIKKDLWSKVGKAAPTKTIFTTNTSSLRPSDFADDTGRPNRFLALHFANRIWAHNTGEVMKHEGTDQDAFDAVVKFAEEINLVPIPLTVEQPGYIINSLLIPWLEAGQSLVGAGIAEPQDVDRVWRLASGSKKGPFNVLDIVGLNTAYAIGSQAPEESVRAFAEKMKAEYIDKGHIGVSSGSGFYHYLPDGSIEPNENPSEADDLKPSGWEKLTVLGSGVLGSQIIMQAAYAGKAVVAYDIKQEFLDKLPERYEWMRSQYRNDLDDYSDEKFDAAIKRITSTTDLSEAVGDADVVIECVPEKLDLKKSVWSDVGEKAPERTVFLTNTSSLRPSDFAEATGRPNHFLALHFANLVWRCNVGEVMAHEGTDPELFDQTLSFAKEINLVPIPIRKEQPGYIQNSLLIPLLEAAQQLVGKGVAEPKDIDKVWRIGADEPVGPFRGMDIIGLNTVVNIANESDDADIRAFAEKTQADYIDKGKTGLAVGEGFYRYDENGEPVDETDEPEVN